MVTSTIKNISNLISSPEKATDDELSYLFQLSKKHQYAGICFVIIAKILKSQNRTGFDNILRSAALRVNNRAYLFNMIQNSPKIESSPSLKPEIKTKEINTKEKLISLGVPFKESTKMLLRTNSRDKDERRKSIENYNIIMFVGDNLGDFDSAFFDKDNKERWEISKSKKEKFGDSFILIPNLIYGDWEVGFNN